GPGQAACRARQWERSRWSSWRLTCSREPSSSRRACFVAPLDVCPDYPLRTGLVHRYWAGAFSAQAKTMVEGLPIFSTWPAGEGRPVVARRSGASCPGTVPCAHGSSRTRRERTRRGPDRSWKAPSPWVVCRPRLGRGLRRRGRDGLLALQHRDRDSPGEQPVLNQRPAPRVVALPPRNRLRCDRDRGGGTPEGAHDELLQVGRTRLEVSEQALGRIHSTQSLA